MTVRRATDKTFAPEGVSDSIDGTYAFQGACAAMSDLIPSTHTKNVWVPRPAMSLMTNFTGFTTPGFISALMIIGDRAYGMISTGRNVGKDEPFSYNIATGSFETVSNVTNANTPNSPSPSGDWVPPSMALVGTKLVVCHPGYNGVGGNMFGWFELNSPTTPVWNSGNTTTTALPSPPTCVANFFGRAYFAVGPATYATAPLTLDIPGGPPTQILTYGDNINITALKGLALGSQLGGIVQSLIVFRGTATPFQVKGDFATNDISRDAMNYAVGTQCPLSLCDTPVGVAVVCTDGLRIIDNLGHYSDPVGMFGDGINLPFLNALVPSRVVAACNASVLRITTQNAGKNSSPFEEYWYHIPRKRWSGPHKSFANMVDAYRNKFVVAPVNHVGALYLSETVPSVTSDYTEFGSQLQWIYTTSFLPDDGRVGIVNYNEMLFRIAIDPGMNSWIAAIQNANQITYDQVTNAVPNTAPFWDVAIWDSAVWDGSASGFIDRLIPWDKPIVSSRAQLSITGGSAPGVIVGQLKYTVEELSYVTLAGV